MALQGGIGGSSGGWNNPSDMESQYERADEQRRAYVAGKDHANYSDEPRQPKGPGVIRRILRALFYDERT